MKLAGRCDKGILRNTNQDMFRIAELSDSFSVVVVCDGMGGTNGGDIASRMACEVITEKMQLAYRPEMDSNSVRNALLSAVNAANSMIYNKADAEREYFGMGTTVVAAAVSDTLAQIVNVGDSRAYHFTDAALTQITTDHSFVQELVNKGEITPEDAYTHPQKNLITRAVGVEREVEADYDEVELKSGDRILLTTDGLTNMCTDEEIAQILAGTNDLEQVLEQLIQAANDGGGTDNITAALIEN